MKQTTRLLILNIVLVFVLAIVSAQEEQETGEIGHIVVGIDGGANVRYYDAGSMPLTVGAILRSNDIVELDMLSTVYVMCADMTIDVITSSSRAPNCVENIENPVWVYRGLPVVDIQRSRGYEGVLYIISPRNTDLLYGNPLISWSPVISEVVPVSYTITMALADGTIVWQRAGIEDTQIDYPGDQSFLHALDESGGQLEYTLSVEAFDGNGVSIQTRLDATNRRNLRVLTPGERTEIEENLSQINSINVPIDSIEDARSYSKSLYLVQNDLFADAYALLQPLVEIPLEDVLIMSDFVSDDFRQSHYLYFLLGDIHRETNLNNFAQLAYERALELAEFYGDTNSQGIAHVRLAELMPDDAISYYEAAIVNFEQSGNAIAATHAQEQLDAINNG